MTDYKTIRGKKVKFFSSDPPAAVGEGQIWYNGTDYKTAIRSEAWASGGNLNEGRFGHASAQAGTQTAALCATGTEGPPWPGIVTSVEEYDGSSWTEQSNVNAGRESMAGCGTQTAGLIFGGSPDSDDTEEYDGTNWTDGGDMNTGRYHVGGAGTQTAGLVFGGYTGTAKTGVTEEYNGSSWANSPGSLNTPRFSITGCGTQTAALGSAGNANPPGLSVNNTEEYDGSSWTAGGSMNTARQDMGAAGIQTNAIVFAGRIQPGSTLSNATEAYDGTSWSTKPNVSTARTQGAGAGTAVAGLLFGGGAPGPSTATEEFTSTAVEKTITDS